MGEWWSLHPGPLYSALVWSVSDTGAVLSVSFGQVCSPVTDKTAPSSATVHTALQSTEAWGADYPRFFLDIHRKRAKMYTTSDCIQ